MKKAGIALIVIGLLFSIFTGFKFFTREKVVDIGKVEISRDKPHRVNWSPVVGVVMIGAGCAMLLMGKRSA